MRPAPARWFLVLVALAGLPACAPMPHQLARSATGEPLAYSVAGPATTPVVVLQSGLGDGRATWRTLWPQLTARHRAYAADRPGYGDSPATTAPRDPCQVARDLHAALAEARVPPPYLLVGHSLGGLYQYVYARLYPQHTAGLLLLDPTHPEHWATLQRESPGTAAVLRGMRSTVFTATMRAEFDAQATCLEGLPELPEGVPAQLLFAGRAGALETPDFQRTLGRLRQDWTQRLGAQAVVVYGSGHYLHHDATERVLQAVDEMAAKARSRQP